MFVKLLPQKELPTQSRELTLLPRTHQNSRVMLPILFVPSAITRLRVKVFAHTILSLLAAILLIPKSAQGSTDDFTFIQASDVHAPMAQSKETIARIMGVGEVQLAPFGVQVPAPSFVIVSGDLNEFGGGTGYFKTYLSYWKGCRIPVYHVLGNHDNTWYSNIQYLRSVRQGPCYSFDQHGCHFVVMMSATPQDPRPSIGEEEILWLRKDLAKVGVSKPVFVALHHPLGGQEFASSYDCERLYDVLHDYNTVLVMAGHSHGFMHTTVAGIDEVTGGSTFGRTAGFSVISVKGGVLRAAYWNNGQPAPNSKLMQKTIPAKTTLPKIEISSPTFRQPLDSSVLVSARLFGSFAADKAVCIVDGKYTNDLVLSGRAPSLKAAGDVDTSKLLSGAHSLRVDFVKGSERHSRSTQFFWDGPQSRTAWRAYLAASSKVTPAICDGNVYVGANDGRLHAFEATTGKALWSGPTGAEILAEPLAIDSKVIAANGSGLVTAYTKTGEKLWSFKAAGPVYSSPILADGKVIFGCNEGKLYAVEAETGKQVWVNQDTTYVIESKPAFADGNIYFGAWDQNVRCVSATNGALVWKQMSEGVRAAKGAKRYYSPGDAMPVISGGKVMIADRSYALSAMDAATGKSSRVRPGVAATGVSEDGKFVYLRTTKGDLVKINPAGKQIWSVAADMDAIPTVPTEKNGVVYVANAQGTVSAISAKDGKVLWQYQASPQLFVMSSIACDGTNAYVTAFDGTLTAIKCKLP